MMGSFIVGTSGYMYDDWRGVFYPQTVPKKEWLKYYSDQFSSVEINATFYGSFTAETFRKWREQVSKNFLFTLKGSRYVTHVKRLKDPEAALQRFFSPSSELGSQLSCVLWQFPKQLSRTSETYARLEKFLVLLPSAPRQVLEFRNTSWFTETVFSLLDHYRIGFVMNDSPHFPSTEYITGDFAYIRFHGPEALYASKYSEATLKSWSGRIKKYLQNYDVYCYFNNDYYGYGVENAHSIRKLLVKQ